MKKLFLFLFLIASCVSLYSKSFDFFWDFGTAYIGGNVGKSDTLAPFEGEADIQVLDFRLEGVNGLTFAFSPFNWWCILNKPQEEDIHLITFANFTAAYDIFKHERLVELAPYVSAYAGALEGIKKFRVDGGLVFNVYSSLMWPEEMVDAEETSHLRGELISAKIGVRLNDLKPQFYFDFGMNLIALGMILCPTDPKEYEPCWYP
ncbi:MAG: hypothetical protein J5710_08515 [Treponema sp.]|nr:hypothetical protein [Treponema sp.]